MLFRAFNKLLGNVTPLIWHQDLSNISWPTSANNYNKKDHKYLEQDWHLRSKWLALREHLTWHDIKRTLTFKKRNKVQKSGIIQIFTRPGFDLNTVFWLKATLKGMSTYINNLCRVTIKLWEILHQQMTLFIHNQQQQQPPRYMWVPFLWWGLGRCKWQQPSNDTLTYNASHFLSIDHVLTSR